MRALSIINTSANRVTVTARTARKFYGMEIMVKYRAQKHLSRRKSVNSRPSMNDQLTLTVESGIRLRDNGISLSWIGLLERSYFVNRLCINADALTGRQLD